MKKIALRWFGFIVSVYGFSTLGNCLHIPVNGPSDEQQPNATSYRRGWKRNTRGPNHGRVAED